MNYDPSDPDTVANPYPHFSALRKKDPIHWNVKLKSWIITRYEDVRYILSSDKITVDRLNTFYSKLPSNEATLLEEIVKSAIRATTLKTVNVSSDILLLYFIIKSSKFTEIFNF